MSLSYNRAIRPYLIREAKIKFDRDSGSDNASSGKKKVLWYARLEVLHLKLGTTYACLDELGVFTSEQKKLIRIHTCLTFIVIESAQGEYHFYDGMGVHRAVVSAEEVGKFDCFSLAEDRNALRDRTFCATFRKGNRLLHYDVNGCFYPHEPGNSTAPKYIPFDFPYLIDRMKLKFQRAANVEPIGRRKVFLKACAEISHVKYGTSFITLNELGPLSTAQQKEIRVHHCLTFFIVEYPLGEYHFYDEKGKRRAVFSAEEIGEFYNFTTHENSNTPLYSTFCATFRRRVREHAFVIRYYNVDGTYFNHEC